MQSEHEQMISKACGHTSGHHTEIYTVYQGVTANHRTPADIVVILSGESRR